MQAAHVARPPLDAGDEDWVDIQPSFEAGSRVPQWEEHPRKVEKQQHAERDTQMSALRRLLEEHELQTLEMQGSHLQQVASLREQLQGRDRLIAAMEER